MPWNWYLYCGNEIINDIYILFNTSLSFPKFLKYTYMPFLVKIGAIHF